MKKVLLCTLLILGISFSCQKEGILPNANESIGIELAQDQIFKDLLKEFENFIQKGTKLDRNSLNMLKNIKNDKEANETIHSLDLDKEFYAITQKLKSLRQKYGENINEQTMTLALKNGEDNFFDHQSYGATEKDLLRLRSVGLPCTDVFDAELGVIAVAYFTAMYGCAGVGPLYPVCFGLAGAGALAATNLAVQAWDQCMYEYYGYY